MLIPAIMPAITAAISAITTAVAAVGPAISSFAASIGPTLSNIALQLKPYAMELANFANSFLQALDILKPGEQITDLGERALQGLAQDIRMDKYDSIEDYFADLRKVELNPEMSEKRSFAEKLVTGLGVGTVALEHKFNEQEGQFNGIWLLPLTNPNYFNSDRMQSLVSSGNLSGNILAYLSKCMTGGESRSFEKGLEKDAQGEQINPELRGELYTALEEAQNKWAEISKAIEGES